MVRKLIVAAAVLAFGSVAGCSGPAGSDASAPRTGESQAASAEWTYTSQFGQTITLPQRPTTIAVDAYTAAALWDYGIRPAGVFGYGLEEGASPLSLGDADRSTMQIVGVGGELQIEKLAAVKPDLVIGFGNIDKKGEAWTWWDDNVADQVTAIAPFLGIKFAGERVVDVIEQYRDLAKTLGGDTDSADVSQSKTDFEAASTSLKTETGQKKLNAIALNGDASTLYAGGTGLAQLGLLKELGVGIVGPKTETVADGESWVELSWELVPDYPADLMLAYAGSTTSFADVAVYRSLPSVKAGQVAVWDDKMPFTYKQYARWLTDVETQYRTAKKLIAE